MSPRGGERISRFQISLDGGEGMRSLAHRLHPDMALQIEWVSLLTLLDTIVGTAGVRVQGSWPRSAGSVRLGGARGAAEGRRR